MSITLVLLLMVFLTMNCLRCLRKQAARNADTELLLNEQLEQIQEIEYDSSSKVSGDHSSTAGGVASEPISIGYSLSARKTCCYKCDS